MDNINSSFIKKCWRDILEMLNFKTILLPLDLSLLRRRKDKVYLEFINGKMLYKLLDTEKLTFCVYLNNCPT